MSKDYVHKLQTFEARPPEKAWDRIVTALDESAAPSLSDRLFFYEQTPPQQVWEAIAAQLPASKGAPVVSIFQRYRRPFRYAGATAALVVVGLLTSLLLSKRSESGSNSVTGPDITQTRPAPSLPASATPATPNTSISMEEIRRPATIASMSEPEPEITDKVRHMDRTGTATRIRQAVRSARLFRNLFSAPEQGRTIALADGSDRYMVYSDGDGRVSRLPKRLYDAIRCKQEDLACQEKIRNLQQKIASSAFTADFTGVLQIIDNLEEKK